VLEPGLERADWCAADKEQGEGALLKGALRVLHVLARVREPLQADRDAALLLRFPPTPASARAGHDATCLMSWVAGHKW